MNKVVLVPDSFKGTMSSEEICAIMKQAILTHFPDAEVVSLPVADGGEGTVDSFLQAVGGEKIPCRVKGPYLEEIDSFYGILPDGTAVVEMAAAAGLPLVGQNKQAHKTSTFGVGELIRHAIESGSKKIILGLGGSATNDLGCGMAAGMGARFFDAKGESFVPVGETLDRIVSIDLSPLQEKMRGVTMVAMCDIDNPLYGEKGAAYVFGPQKGADDEMVKILDQKLRSASEVIKNELRQDICELPGAGAAGGMGGGAVAFFGATLQMGIETVLDTVHFDALAKDADFVFSGEGKIDTQSLRGKVVIGVARRTKKLGVPLIAVVGDIGDQVEAAYEEGVTGIFSINRVAVPFREAKPRAKEDLRLTVDNLVRFIGSLGK